MIPKHMTIIVTGLSRSGSSLMMQILHSAGIPTQIDFPNLPETDADEHNPYGYYEYQPINFEQSAHASLHMSKGKAVKMLMPRLQEFFVPIPGQFYYFIHMHRPIADVIISKAKIKEWSHIHKRPDGIPWPVIHRTPQELQVIRDGGMAFMAGLKNVHVQDVNFQNLMTCPTSETRILCQHLGIPGITPLTCISRKSLDTHPHLCYHSD